MPFPPIRHGPMCSSRTSQKPLENVMISLFGPTRQCEERKHEVQNVQNPGEYQRFLLSSKRSNGLPKNIDKGKMIALCKVERGATDRRIVRIAIFRSYQLWLDYFAPSLVCRQQTPGIQRTLGDLQAIGWASLRNTRHLLENSPAR